MTAESQMPLQAREPEVLILGDSIVDWLVYDMRAEDAEKSLAWTTPLSRDDWHYAAGFETRQCLAGAPAIHAMLWANDIAVAGNSFQGGTCKPEKSGSFFVLRKRNNAGKSKEERTRSYLMTCPEEHGKTIIDKRGVTWRAATSLLNEGDEGYTNPFDEKDCNHRSERLRVVCLWDVKRGYLPQEKKPDTGDWKATQKKLFGCYRKLRGDKPDLPILIRTSDPSRFKLFLKKLAEDNKPTPTVVLICALGHLDDGDRRGSGTWSGVWSQVYDYLSDDDARGYLFNSKGRDWRFSVVVPIYQDGVLWIGPDQWPIEIQDRIDKFKREDSRPLGRLFAVPGAQPGLSEFEEHSGMVGVHTLLTYSILEHLVTAGHADFSAAIKQGLMRAKRLRNRGYCDPSELTSIRGAGGPFYISYPHEVWKKGRRDVTDRLLQIDGPSSDQCAGPYEVKCKVDFPANCSGRSVEIAADIPYHGKEDRR